MITYRDTLDGIGPEHLHGFFVGWPDPPSPEMHLCILAGSAHVVLAWDAAAGRVAGFITALTDGALTAYIPLLEVLPDYQGRGIGRELVQRMLHRLEGLRGVDLCCDPELKPFYEHFGMRAVTGMVLRRRPEEQAR